MAKEDKINKSNSKVKKDKPKTTLRERNIKAAEKKDKPKRIRKAANTAVKPVSKTIGVLKSEHHVLPRKENPGFFTKSRRLFPPYFYESTAELKNVTWPGRKETWKLVIAVFVFAFALGGFVAIIDYGLEKIFRTVIL